jgi:isocitrate dehydrogenase
LDKPTRPNEFTTPGCAPIEDGIHTYDIFDEGVSKQKVGTKEFAQAVVDRLGKKPNTLKAVTYNQADQEELVSETIVKERSDTKKGTRWCRCVP